MKRNFFKYAALSAIALIGFVSCEKKDEVKLNQNNTENPYSDEEILNAVKFVGQGGLQETSGNRLKSGNEGVRLITIELGKGDDCDGKGVCHLWLGPIKIFNQKKIDENKFIQMKYDGKADLSDLESIEIYLAEKANIDMSQVSFPVDREIIIVNETAAENKVERIVRPQQSVFNPNLGKHGGFAFKVDKLSDYQN